MAWFLLIAVPLMLSEFTEVSPWLALRLIRACARMLRDQESADRFIEEWGAELERIPGKLTKLAYALGRLLLLPLTFREVALTIRKRKSTAINEEPAPRSLQDALKAEQLRHQRLLLEQQRRQREAQFWSLNQEALLQNNNIMEAEPKRRFSFRTLWNGMNRGRRRTYSDDPWGSLFAPEEQPDE